MLIVSLTDSHLPFMIVHFPFARRNRILSLAAAYCLLGVVRGAQWRRKERQRIWLAGR